MNTALHSPYKVLFVDDETMAVKYFSQTLEDTLEVLTAGGVDEAIAILDAEHANIGVLVSDQRMPGKQGVELLEYARQNYPQITRILATAYADLTDAIAAVNSGEIFRYIKKPWDADQLIIDVKIAMDMFTLKLERDELISAKMSVFQRLVMLGRIKDLVLIGAALKTELPKAPLAFKNYLSNAHLALQSTDKSFVIDVDQLDLGTNLVIETQRSTALMTELAKLTTSAAVLEPSCLALQTQVQTLLGSAQAPISASFAHLQAESLRCYQDSPTTSLQGQTIEIKGVPAHDHKALWGGLTAGLGADLGKATQWLSLYLWAAQAGLSVSLQKHTASELCVVLTPVSATTDPAQAIDAQWLDDLFDQFSQ